MKNIADIVAECLDEIGEGKTTIEECLTRYNDIRVELEPLLKLGLDVQALPRVTPSNSFKATTRAAIMEHIHDEQMNRGKRFSVFGGFLRPVWVRALVIALAVVIVLGSAGSGTVFASSDALPGDTLYTVKTGWEDVRDWLETDEIASADLQMEFAERRLQEMARLLEVDPDRLIQAISGYENNLQKALDEAIAAGNIVPMEAVATGISDHLEQMDDLEEVAGTTQSIGRARETAMNRQMTALRSIAGSDAATAGNLTVAVMQQQMQRAAGTNAQGQTQKTEQALQQFLSYAGLCEEIRAGAGEQGAVLDELYTTACLALQNEFAGIAGDVSPQLAGEIENTFSMMKQHRYGQSEESGPGYGPAGGQGSGSDTNNQGTGMQNQAGAAGGIAGGATAGMEGSEEQTLVNEGAAGQNDESEPQTTMTPPQQPAGPEQGQGAESPGQGPGNDETTDFPGDPQGIHS